MKFTHGFHIWLHIIIAVVSIVVDLIKIQDLGNLIGKKNRKAFYKSEKRVTFQTGKLQSIRESKYTSNCLTEYFTRGKGDRKDEMLKCHYSMFEIYSAAKSSSEST